MDTLYLSPGNWDLEVDISGNIAMASNPYSQAQDAASQIRTFQGEVWYNTANGIPYWQAILGKSPPISIMKAYFNGAALKVPGVVTSTSFLAAIVERRVTGQVQITTDTGQSATAGF